jgi:hypothetical protein
MNVNYALPTSIARPKFGRSATAHEIESIGWQAQNLFGHDALPVQMELTHVKTQKRIFAGFRSLIRAKRIRRKMDAQSLLTGQPLNFTEVTKFHSRCATDDYMNMQRQRALENPFLISGSMSNSAICGNYKDSNTSVRYNIGKIDSKTILSQIQIQPDTN